MNINELINELEENQTPEMVHQKREKIKQDKIDKKRHAQWARVRDVLPKLQADFKEFEGVIFNGYYGWKMYRSELTRPTKSSSKLEIEPHSSGTFKCRDGNFCHNIQFNNRGGEYFQVQAQLNPKTGKMIYCLSSAYYTFEEAKPYLDLEEGHGYKINPLPIRHETFHKYEDLTQHLLDFFKFTVNIESLKKKHKIINIEKNEKTNVISIAK